MSNSDEGGYNAFHNSTKKHGSVKSIPAESSNMKGSRIKQMTIYDTKFKFAYV